MPRIDGGPGPSPVTDGWNKSTGNQVATVQIGESKLSDVAKRLNVDANSLQQANPHIADPAKLQVGQEIRLPQYQASQNQQQDDDQGVENEASESDLPCAPIGDSLAKSALQAQFEGSSHPKETRELSSADLAQVAGGAQPGTINANKFSNKIIKDLNAISALKISSKWIKPDQSIDAQKTFNKVPNFNQVAGGAGREIIDTLKDAYKATDKAYGKVQNEFMKTGDKPLNKASDKVKGGAKINQVVQDITTNKSKTADKAYTQMDGYIKQ
jgi:hypothetical protein